MEPLSTELRASLMQELDRGSVAYVRNLAAAEQAVQRGQFNVAKVLRAAAYAQRTTAFNAARILERDVAHDPNDLLTTILAEQQPVIGLTSTSLPVGPATAREMLDRTQVVQDRVATLMQRSLDSLAAHPDVLERDVPIILFSCLVCGNPIEGSSPQQCDVCGAIRPEFEIIGPYYGITHERLGRLNPQEVIATLVPGPAQLAALIADVDDALLRRKPTEPEWSIKEIVAHMIETDYMCLVETQVILTQAPYSNDKFPWETHLGKEYEELPAAILIEKMTNARAATLDLFRSLAPADWSKKYFFGIYTVSVLDMGIWHANHDVGHLAQVRRLLKMWQVLPA